MIVAGLSVSYLRGSDEGTENQSSLPIRGNVVISNDPIVRVVYPGPLAGSARQVSPLQNEPAR